MTDIALVWRNAHGDIAQDGYDLLTDDSIETAVIISLFTDRQAEPGDVIPDGTADRRGYWGDGWRTRPIGSRLWLLSREKNMNSVIVRAETYAAEALQWLLDDGLAGAVSVHASAPAKSVLMLVINIELPDGSPLPQFKFTTQLQGV